MPALLKDVFIGLAVIMAGVLVFAQALSAASDWFVDDE